MNCWLSFDLSRLIWAFFFLRIFYTNWTSTTTVYRIWDVNVPFFFLFQILIQYIHPYYTPDQYFRFRKRQYTIIKWGCFDHQITRNEKIRFIIQFCYWKKFFTRIAPNSFCDINMHAETLKTFRICLFCFCFPFTIYTQTAYFSHIHCRQRYNIEFICFHRHSVFFGWYPLSTSLTLHLWSVERRLVLISHQCRLK